jgi:hypothetical protein
MAKEKDSRFIPGIYNYCDRWCERCAFTHRCRVYATQKEFEAEAGAPESQPEHNQAYWDQLEKYSADSADEWQIFSSSEGEEDAGMELDMDFTEEELEEAREDHDRKESEAKKRGSVILQSAEAYSWRLQQFIKEHGELFRQPPDEIDPAVITAAGGDVGDEAKGVWLQDALEVIAWHQFFITVKLTRAYHSLVEEEEHEHEWPRDSDGTAKVALIGLDRSIAAWAVVRDMLPAYKNVALDFRARLHRLRAKVQEQFPNARAFVRPGFDDHPKGPKNST